MNHLKSSSVYIFPHEEDYLEGFKLQRVLELPRTSVWKNATKLLFLSNEWAYSSTCILCQAHGLFWWNSIMCRSSLLTRLGVVIEHLMKHNEVFYQRYKYTMKRNALAESTQQALRHLNNEPMYSCKSKDKVNPWRLFKTWINILIQIYIRIVHLNIPIHYIYIQVRDINIHTQLHWKDRSKTSKGSWETIFGKQTFYYIRE